MAVNTLSGLISDIVKFETALGNVYTSLEELITKEPFFKNISEEHQKICKELERAYNNSITDALESTFFSKEIKLPNLDINKNSTNLKNELLNLEKQSIIFYESIKENLKNYNKILNRYIDKLLAKHKIICNKLEEISR